MIQLRVYRLELPPIEKLGLVDPMRNLLLLGFLLLSSAIFNDSQKDVPSTRLAFLTGLPRSLLSSRILVRVADIADIGIGTLPSPFGVVGRVASSAARSRSEKLDPPGVVVGGGPCGFLLLGVVGGAGRFCLDPFLVLGNEGVLFTEALPLLPFLP